MSKWKETAKKLNSAISLPIRLHMGNSLPGNGCPQKIKQKKTMIMYLITMVQLAVVFLPHELRTLSDGYTQKPTHDGFTGKTLHIVLC